MPHKTIHTDLAPKVIGPYSQAVIAGEWVFLSGQIPLDPNTQQLVSGPFDIQAKRVLDNINAVLGAAGCGMFDIVKTTVYLTDLANFPAFNEVYERYFRTPYPARSTMQVAALPKGAVIEIDVVARKAS